MEIHERKRYATLHVVVGFILAAVCIWDIWGLGVSNWTYYYPFKVFSVSFYFLIAYLIYFEKISPVNGFDASIIFFYIYSFIGTKYLHPTYIFSFYEGLGFISFYYTGPMKRYSLLSLFGLILAVYSVQYTPEPDFVKAGYSIREHLHILTVIFGILAFVIYWFFNRQRQLLFEKEQKFASIGRQSAFLLHELKSPLSRFLISNSERENRDADYILSIVEGVELLVTKKENLIFGTISWKEIESYLAEEFRTLCQYYKIQFEMTGFHGEGVGHRSTIKLALKNLIRNAVEAIAREGKEGTIKVSLNQRTIEVANNGPEITKEMITNLFSPFFSGKDSGLNFGIGLHFVDSVVKAHNGTIDVTVEDGWNVFRVRLGEST